MATTTGSKLRAEWVNPFLTSAKHVWQHGLKSELELVTAELVTHQFTTEDLTAVSRVNGKLKGKVLYGFSEDCAKNIVAKWLEWKSVTEIDRMSLTALSEIAGIITGNAATLLAQNGFPCTVTPPVIIEPAGSRFTIRKAAQIRVTFDSDVGILRIGISLSETERAK